MQGDMQTPGDIYPPFYAYSPLQLPPHPPLRSATMQYITLTTRTIYRPLPTHTYPCTT